MSQPSEILDRTAQGLVRAAGYPSRFALRQILDFLESIGECLTLLAGSLRFIASRRVVWRDAVNQMSSIGVDSLVLVMITVAFSGAVLALYSTLVLARWGVSSYIGGGLVLSVVREIGPVLTAVVVAARAGSAIAAEIGTMKVTEQVDALRSLAISPVEYLVAPRILASLVVFPMLTVFADFMGAFGGYLVAVARGVSGGAFLESIETLVEAYDITMGLVKAVVFGVVVSLVCCQQGLRTRGGATGVGRSTTNAVVISIVLIYILNFFLAYLIFGRQS